MKVQKWKILERQSIKLEQKGKSLGDNESLSQLG